MRFFHKRVCIFDKMSSKMLGNLIVSKIAKTIHDNDPLAEAYLFGSRARGDSKPNSDWDILILVNDTKVTNEIYLP